MTEPKQPAGPAMTLGNMRAQPRPSRLRLFFAVHRIKKAQVERP
jgi:hypothetical protein